MAVLTKSQIKRAGSILGRRRRSGSAADQKTEAALQVLQRHRMNHTGVWLEVAGFLQSQTHGMSRVQGSRLKREARIIAKLARPNPPSLATMRDIAGVRLVLSGTNRLAQQSRLVELVVAGLLQRGLVQQTIQFVEEPRSTGYRAVHVVVSVPSNVEKSAEGHALVQGTFVEIQIRTWNQHRWANTAETLQDAGFGDIKSGDMSDDLRTMLLEFSAACHEADRIGDDSANLRAFEIQQALLALPSPRVS